MTKDLLAVLRQENAVPQESYETGNVTIPEGDNTMDIFFAEVEWIRQTVDQIESQITPLCNKHSEMLSAPQQNEKTKMEIEELTDSINSSASKVRQKLKDLEISINSQAAGDPASATVRLRRTQLISSSTRLTEIMKQYALAQADYKERCKAMLKRQLEVAECPRTDAELEEMLESDNPQIFTQGILMDTQQARQNAADIEARHEDILKLEKSIRELHDLFVDLAALVNEQSEMINQIEYNVANTKDHVESAKLETHKAVVYKRKSRKMKFIIIAVVAVIVIILIVVLVTQLT